MCFSKVFDYYNWVIAFKECNVCKQCGRLIQFIHVFTFY